MNTKPNSHSEKNRRLTTIVFLDIEGYSALMQTDEQHALELLTQLQDLLGKSLPEHNGRIIQNYGDGYLLLFDSATQGVQSMVEIQLQSIKDQIPLRIGIHLGEVIEKNDNVFGDGVNIASRVESLGVAGSILISQVVKDQIQNKSTFTIKSLGRFEFKNIQEPIEIFAIINEGLSVPQKNNLSGKTKKKKNKIWPWLVGGMIVLAALTANIILKNQSDSIPQVNHFENDRIIITPFNNETDDERLNGFGKLISDWITNGLMEFDEINILNAQNLTELLGDYNHNELDDHLRSTGARYVIRGNYYTIENEFFISAQINDLSSGLIAQKINLKGLQSDRTELLEELAEEILSFWNIRGLKRFQQNPPKYQAFLDYQQGLDLHLSAPVQALEYYERAYQKDTTFFAPLFGILSIEFSGTGVLPEIASYLESRKHQFSKWDQLTFDQYKAINSKNYLQAAKINEQKVKMDPSDEYANYNAAYFYNRSFHYRKGLDLLENYEKRFISDENKEISWRDGQRVFALYKLGEYHQIDRIAQAYNFPKMLTPLAIIHLGALVRLDSLDRLKNEYKSYRIEGLYEPNGQLSQPGHLLINIINELILNNRRQEIGFYMDELTEWVNTTNSFPVESSFPDLANNRPFREKEVLGYLAFFQRDYDGALDYWLSEDIPESNWPDHMERSSRVGVCYAYLGDTLQARNQLNLIESITGDKRNTDVTKAYYKTRIYSALRDFSNATLTLSFAKDKGMINFRPYVLDQDVFLKEFIEREGFKQIIQPVDLK